MNRAALQKVSAARGWVLLCVWLAAPEIVSGAPHVEFDFARSAECRDVTTAERATMYPTQRLVEFLLPVSVRFRDVPAGGIDELTIEITGTSNYMRVYDFAPATQLTTDIAAPIETTTTTKSARSLDGSLGGALPIPYAAEVAHVTPTINAGIANGETKTEKLNRLPPKNATVVSGTLAEGRGVFFKLKPSSQTSLEGVHELAVTFIVPAGWRGGNVHVGCSAGGQRKMLFIKQSATLGAEGSLVRLYLGSAGHVRRVAKPVVAEAASPENEPTPVWRPNRMADVTAAEVAELVKEVKAKPAMYSETKQETVSEIKAIVDKP